MGSQISDALFLRGRLKTILVAPVGSLTVTARPDLLARPSFIWSHHLLLPMRWILATYTSIMININIDIDISDRGQACSLSYLLGLSTYTF